MGQWAPSLTVVLSYQRLQLTMPSARFAPIWRTGRWGRCHPSSFRCFSEKGKEHSKRRLNREAPSVGVSEWGQQVILPHMALLLCLHVEWLLVCLPNVSQYICVCARVCVCVCVYLSDLSLMLLTWLHRVWIMHSRFGWCLNDYGNSSVDVEAAGLMESASGVLILHALKKKQYVHLYL